MKHLKVYKIRRKVTISPCVDLSLWAVLPRLKNSEVPDILSPEKAPICVTDPRTELMGWRLVLDNEVDPQTIIASCQQGDIEEYHRHRYSIGKCRSCSIMSVYFPSSVTHCFLYLQPSVNLFDNIQGWFGRRYLRNVEQLISLSIHSTKSDRWAGYIR